MNFKSFWKDSLAAFIIKRLIAATLIIVALAWGVLFLLDLYTHHGESVKVPDLQGLFLEEAQNLLHNQQLYAEVIDSVYIKGKALGTIVQQIPSPDLPVKKNRAIYLILNKRQVNMVPFPNLRDVSLRQAEAMMNSLGLRISNIIYQPSEFKDLVIDVNYMGERVEVGTRIPEGASVSLVVGSGLGGDLSIVPNLRTLSYDEARDMLLSHMFVLGAVEYDYPPEGDENAYFIYRQSPEPDTGLAVGSRVNIWLSKDMTKALHGAYDDAEEDDPFF